MTVIAIDPGTSQSALVVYDGERVTRHDILPNDDVLALLRDGSDLVGTVVIEEVESFGMAVGKEVFTTVRVTGRFQEAWFPGRCELMPRRIVKQHLCHTARATDANIRQALIDRYGPSLEVAIGKKKTPGPLFGIKSHEWAALAIAVTWHDLKGHLPPEIRSGVRPDF